MASLALPGMSGFASELSVFVGVATSDIYGTSFRAAIVFLAAVGVVLTPIYLLSMLRQLFYNCGTLAACDLEDLNLQNQRENLDEAVCFGNSCVLPGDAQFIDAKPREVAIAFCFLIPIVGIGFYPNMAMQVYDATTVAVNAEVRQSYTLIVQENPQIYAKGFLAPKIAQTPTAPALGQITSSESASTLGIVK